MLKPPKKVLKLLLSAMAFFLTVCVGTTFASDWPCFRGPNHDGITAEGIERWPPQELWRANVGEGYSQVVVSQGRVYTIGWVGNRDYVWCFNESSTGTNPAPLWTNSYSCSYGDSTYQGTRSTPTISGSNVYTFSADGRLNCFDTISGSCLWSNTAAVGKPGWGFASSPLVEGDLVIVNAGSNGMAVAVTGATHNVVWGNISSSDGAGYSSPYAVTIGTQRTVIVHSMNVCGLDPATGNTLWYFPWSGGSVPPGIANSAIVDGNKLWVSHGYGIGCALVNLGGSGKLTNTVWTPNTQMANKENASVICNGYAYGVSEGGGLRCLDLSNGTINWSSTNSSAMIGTESAVLLANDELVVICGADGGANGSLIVAQAAPTGYHELHYTNNIISGNSWTCPTLANGKMYLRSQNGTLICYDVSYSANAFSNCIPPVDWMDHYYAGTNNYTNAAAGDTDHDGMTAWQEYVAGTDPTNNSSCLKTTILMSNNNIIVTYPAIAATNAAYAGRARYYGLESLTNLLNSTWQPVPGCTNILGTNTSVFFTNSAPAGVGFYRVRARLQ